MTECHFHFKLRCDKFSQEYNEADGLNIGGIHREELNFWSAPDPKVDLFPDDEASPHVHLTDWGNEFPDLPIGFTGARSHLDIAFFTRTAAEVLNDPTAGNAFGEKLIATKVPEPSLTLALIGLGLIGVKFRHQDQQQR